jgi:hypothetical protein
MLSTKENNMSNKFNFEGLRNSIGWKLANQDRFRFIPFRKKLGDMLQTEAAKKDLEDFGNHMGQAFAAFKTHTEELTKRSDSAKHWLSREEYDNIPGGSIAVMDAIQTMLYIFGGYEEVADLFERYFVSEKIFQESVGFFMMLPRHLEVEGYMTEGRWSAKVMADAAGYEPIISLYIARNWARCLVLCDPDKWDIDKLIDEIKKL